MALTVEADGGSDSNLPKRFRPPSSLTEFLVRATNPEAMAGAALEKGDPGLTHSHQVQNMETPNGGSPPGHWFEKRVRLKFSFGGILLHSAWFDALVLDEHLANLGSDPADPCPSFEGIPRGICAALISSHPIREQLARVALVRGTVRYVRSQYRRFYIDLNGSYSDYLKRFSSQRRNHLTRMVRKFEKSCGGYIRWREYERPEEMAEFHRLARQVSQKTYQEKLVDAGLSDSEEFRQEITRLAASGGVRGQLLFYGERPIAYQFCRADAGILTYEVVGYDPEFRQHSPGTVLLLLTLQKLFSEQSFFRFDLGKGEYAYKETLSTASDLCADIYYFRFTLRNFLLVASHAALTHCSDAVAALLAAFRLKQRIKRLLHRGASKSE